MNNCNHEWVTYGGAKWCFKCEVTRESVLDDKILILQARVDALEKVLITISLIPPEWRAADAVTLAADAVTK